MKATKKQELARQRNWALFQVRSIEGNLVRAMKMMGMSTLSLEEELKWTRARIKEFYNSKITTLKD